MQLALIAVVAVTLVVAAVIAGLLLREPSNTSGPATTSYPSETSYPSTSESASTTYPPSTSRLPTPVAVAALDGLLLTPDQINAAMGSNNLPVVRTLTTPYDDAPNTSDKACLPILSVAQQTVYAGTNWTALRQQELYPPTHDRTHFVQQAVVLFPSAQDATTFFTSSSQSWATCTNRPFTRSVAGQPNEVWTVGPVANNGGTLSAIKTLQPGYWTWDSCQRALTVANNVAIDVVACTQIKSEAQSGAGVNIASQIAAKVPTT